jgi:putative methyltransferase (TIGR04325 family)
MKVWEGVYARFDEVPAAGPGFDGPVWTERSRAAVATLRNAPRTFDEGFLAGVVARRLGATGAATVLDFGGGLGTGYVRLRGCLAGPAGLHVAVVEREAVCREGAALFDGDPHVRFHSDLPADLRPDVVHLGSSLQYVDDWRGLIARLAGYRASEIAFTDLTAGDIESFVTAQRYFASTIPVRFFRLAEVVETLAAAGYRLAGHTLFLATVAARTGPLPLDDFPAAHRLPHTCNLLFVRSEDEP